MIKIRALDNHLLICIKEFRHYLLNKLFANYYKRTIIYNRIYMMIIALIIQFLQIKN